MSIVQKKKINKIKVVLTLLAFPSPSLTSEAPSSRNLLLSETKTTRTVTPEHHKKSVSEKVSKPSMSSQSTLQAKRDITQHRKTKSCPGTFPA